MPILSIIPADQVLAVAIKDATKSTSTVNPARITTAVQKMRPDWSVNKRRVKRLLRSMNNDAWKAAVPPSTTDMPSTAVDASSPVSSSPSTAPATAEPTTDATSGGRRPGRAARAAAARRTKNAAAAAASSDDKAMAGNVCDTAPASPGSPGGFLAAASLGSPPCTSGGFVSRVAAGGEVSSRDAPKTATLEAAGGEPPADSLPPDAAGEAPTAGAPWDETVVDAEDGGAGSSETDELSDSLRLEPDIELEPGVDLKADLRLAAVTEYAGSESVIAANCEGDGGVPTAVGLEDIALTSVDSDAPLLVSATTSEVMATEDRESAMSASVLDLGFEMIHKDEAAGAATAAAAAAGGSDGSGVTTGMGAKSGKTSRKGWPWSWGRN